MQSMNGRVAVRPTGWRLKGSAAARLRVGAVLAGLLVAVVSAAAAAYPRPGFTEQVSVALDGGRANGSSYFGVVSADGRTVAFQSSASNLVPGDGNGTFDIFVHVRDSGTVERVSVASDGVEGNDWSDAVSMSADGRWIAFGSRASNLVPGDGNEKWDVFVHDREAGTTDRVSVATGGAEGNDLSSNPAISADGRYVAFYSRASNLVPGDGNGVFDIFVHDRETGVTERVSVATDGGEGNNDSVNAAISADGRHVAFSSQASNLVSDDTNATSDVFVHDRDSGTTERVSVAPSGTEGNGISYAPAISADGRHVAFASNASNLVPADTNNAFDVFVHDREAGTIERVSVTTDGGESNGISLHPTMSADGRHVAFHGGASNLVPGDDNDAWDAFIHDRETGTIERVSVAADRGEGDGQSFYPRISADGGYIALHSYSPDSRDVFVHERGPATGIGTITTSPAPGEVAVSGWATFSGATLTSAADPEDDGGGVGPLSAHDLGAEITGASVISRTEAEDLLVRLRLTSLPEGGRPGVLYRWSFLVRESAWEVRALRAGATAVPPTADPYFALYDCTLVCTETARLSGGIGTGGLDVRVSVPLEALGAEEGAELTNVQASTAVGEAAAGALVTLDDVALPDGSIPVPRVQLGAAPASTPEQDVAFDTGATLTDGDFSGTVDIASLPEGARRVWARACLGEICGVASRALGEPPVEMKSTLLDLTAHGRGTNLTLSARLSELDAPHVPIADRTIAFYSDDELIGSDATDSHGVATVPVPPEHLGANRTYQAVFTGDDAYTGSSDHRPGKGRKTG